MEEIDYGTSTIMLNRMDNTLELLNRAIAELEWQALANRSIVPSEMYMHFVRLKLKLRNEWCAKLMDLQNNGVSVKRKLLRFLCKGPKYTDEIAKYGTYLHG